MAHCGAYSSGIVWSQWGCSSITPRLIEYGLLLLKRTYRCHENGVFAILASGPEKTAKPQAVRRAWNHKAIPTKIMYLNYDEVQNVNSSQIKRVEEASLTFEILKAEWPNFPSRLGKDWSEFQTLSREIVVAVPPHASSEALEQAAAKLREIMSLFPYTENLESAIRDAFSVRRFPSASQEMNEIEAKTSLINHFDGFKQSIMESEKKPTDTQNNQEESLPSSSRLR